MKTPAIITCVLGCLLLTGCRTDSKIHMLEQECRMHEDRIYALQDRLQMTESELRAAQQQSAAMCEPSLQGPKRGPSSKSKDPHADAPVSVDVQLPGDGMKEISPAELGNLGVPKPEPKGESKPSISNPDAQPSLETPEAPPLKQWNSPSDNPGSDKSQTKIKDGKVLYRQEGPRLKGDSRKVKKITISKLMTGGVNADGQEGDEGVFVVVEPRDEQGRLVPAVGAVSIVAIDPALPEEKSRVARWDFSAAEVANQFRRSGSAEGFHLEVRWPDGPPPHEQLQLFVRYLTADTRKLYAEVPIQIALTPKSTTLVARPDPRNLDKDTHGGWASKPKSAAPAEVASGAGSPSPDSPTRVAWGPSTQLRQSIPPANNSASAKRPAARSRPVWSPQR